MLSCQNNDHDEVMKAGNTNRENKLIQIGVYDFKHI